MKELDKKIFESFRIDEKMIDVTPQNPRRPNSNTKIDDKIPFIASELDATQIVALITKLKNFSTDRKELYDNYRYMLKDSIIGSAMEMIAEDASLVSEVTDMSYWISSDDKTFEAFINKWLKDTIDINKEAFTWAFRLLIDGEIFLETFDSHEDAKTKFVIPGDYFDLIDKNYLINDLRIYGKSIGFHVVNENDALDNKIYNNKEFIHIMRDMGDYDEVVVEFTKDGVINKRAVKAHYGRSFLYNAIQIYNIIDLIDTSLLSQYINKTQVTRLVKVEVGSSNRKETARIIDEIKKAFRLSRLDLDKAYKEGNKASTISNVYIPTRNGKADTTIDAIGGDSNIQDISGLDTYLSRLFSAIRVPKEFLGLGEAGGFLDASMMKKDLRYCRMVTRLQDLICRTITECIKFKCSKTKYNGKIPKYEINYTQTSSVEEIENLEELNMRLGLASSLAEFLGGNEHVDPKEFADYIINDLMKLEGAHKFFDKEKKFQTPPDDEDYGEVEDNGGKDREKNDEPEL